MSEKADLGIQTSSRTFSESEDDFIINSQQQSTGRLQRKTTLAWLVPLLQSVLDYSDTTTSLCVSKIIDFLHDLLGE